MKAARIIVSGRVQGVFYRESTKRQAELLGVSGWVRNLDDGSVEIFAFGDNIDMLIRWCWQGPPASKVNTVKVEETAPDDVKGFSIR